MENRELHSRLDDLFNALANPRRRQLLFTLADHDSQSTFTVPDDVIVRGQQDECLLMMIHNHLPKLANLGLIAWDRENNEVRRGPHFDEVEPLLNLLGEAGFK